MGSQANLPLVAIVGRPNVGKSSFFNRLIGQRKSLVKDLAGVTRDRVYGEADYLGRHFMLVDTGGFEPNVPDDHIYRHVREQAMLAIDEADIILYFADGRAGLVPNDTEVVSMLREGTDKPILCVVNKIDSEELEAHAYEFYELGFDRIFPISVEGGRGGDDLLDHMIEFMPEPNAEAEEEEKDVWDAKIALIGRPNVGKSSTANRLLGEDRQVIHNTPGTTRDSVDLPFEYDGRPYLLIDTAGVRRSARISDKLERFTVIKAFKALSGADLAILLIDPTEMITGQEQRLAGMVEEKGKALIIAVNKWDLVRGQPGFERKEIETVIREKMQYVKFAPIHFMSALTGSKVNRLMPLVAQVRAQHNRTIPTGELNTWLQQVHLYQDQIH